MQFVIVNIIRLLGAVIRYVRRDMRVIEDIGDIKMPKRIMYILTNS